MEKDKKICGKGTYFLVNQVSFFHSEMKTFSSEIVAVC